MGTYLTTKKQKECCSCRACELVCPRGCIIMKEKEGHYYPYIDSAECIKCGLCVKTCQYNQNSKKMVTGRPVKVFSAWNRACDIVKKSSSGGIFSAIANWGRKNGYQIFAAKFTGNMNVVISEVCHEDSLDLYRGAKYVKSDVGDTYEQVKKALKSNMKIIYFGSPCQIGGLKKYLGRDYDHLILVDIICHGMPGQKLFDQYLLYLENKYNSSVGEFYFRYKKEGVTPYIRVVFHNGKVLEEPAKDNIYMKIYNSMYGLMPSCTNCLYTSIKRESDITIGDFWNLESIDKNRTNYWGTSIVLCNSLRGRQFFECIEDELTLYESNIDEALNSNPQLSYPPLGNPLNSLFMRLLGRISIKKLYIIFVIIGNRVLIPYRMVRKIKNFVKVKYI